MPDDPTIDQRLTALEQLHANFQIVGGSNVTVEGSIHKGYAICSTCPDVGEVVGGGVIPVTPPPTTGACCVSIDCSITTETNCTEMGGTYQGDGTECDPNPCIERCGFIDCDGILGYRTRTTVVEWTASNPAASCGDCSTSGSYTTIEQYNDEFCITPTISCEGASSIDCGSLDFSCLWNLVDGDCLAEPVEDCPANINTLFILCAHTCDPVTNCIGNVYTQTCDANEGTGTITFTQTLSDFI
jgi:hypothetical protein